ncbi:MAG TPA: hypothetical protein VE223_01265 [Nitrososphaeraceae archaeon]|nr:hypothetical protein [Nitrososphaeraceae archaeon]
MIARGSVDNITLYIIFLLLPVLQRNYIIIYTDTRYFSVAYDHFIAKAKNSLNVRLIPIRLLLQLPLEEKLRKIEQQQQQQTRKRTTS